MVYQTFCLQVPQQALQRLLVVVMLLPAGEVADMTCAADICCPGFCGLHHGLIEANRKEHFLVVLALLFKRGFYFVFNPLTLDSMF